MMILKKKLRENYLTLEESFELIKEKLELILPFKDILDFLLGFYLRTGGFPSPIENYLREGVIDKKNYETIVNIILSDISKRNKS
jgi:predicted AAA+ superfamily ATPase